MGSTLVFFDRYIEGLIKAGLKGDPSGYYKLDDAKKLSGKEIKKLLNGKSRTGYFVGYQWSISSAKNGDVTFSLSKGGFILIQYNGKQWIEGDLFCLQFEKRFDGIKHCGEIFYNPQGNDQSKSKYFSVGDKGIYLFFQSMMPPPNDAKENIKKPSVVCSKIVLFRF